MNAGTLTPIPHNGEVERNILGVLMLAPERIGEAAERLDPQDFFFSLNRKIYSAMLDLDGAGKPIDVFTLHEILAREKELEDSGGLAFLSSLDKLAYRKAPLGDYARIVKEAAALRRVLSLCESTTAKISEGRPSAQVLETVAADFDSIRDENRSLERVPVHISVVTMELRPVLERAANGTSQMIGTPTGYPDIARLTPRWHPADSSILAPPPTP